MMDNINILIDKTFTEINTYSQYTKKQTKTQNTWTGQSTEEDLKAQLH